MFLRTIFATEKFPMDTVKSIFLAGPTPRSSDVASWRPEALAILENLGYTGDVYIPELRSGLFLHSYDDQIDWELEGLSRADVVLFWIPREITTMPAFTTNVEFGLWIKSKKCVVGFPPEAEKVRYLEYLCNTEEVPVHNSLHDTLQYACDLLGEGAHRVGGECTIPIPVWNHPSFKEWYQDLKIAGNRLDKCELLWSFYTEIDTLFFFALKVGVYISSESRYKTNEVIIGRPNTCSAILYHKEDDLDNTEIVLVREFRSPVSNSSGYVRELPGGSSKDPSTPLEDVILSEILEETGLTLDPSRLKKLSTNQMAATSLINKTTLFTVSLSKEEINKLKNLKDNVFGNIEDTERTYVEVWKLKDIMPSNLLDWTTIGMIYQGIK